MEKHLNNKKQHLFMKSKLLFIFFSFIICLSTVNALTIDYDQTSNNQEYLTSPKGNLLVNTFIAQTDETLFIINATTNYTYDISYEFPSLTRPVIYTLNIVKPQNVTIICSKF